MVFVLQEYMYSHREEKTEETLANEISKSKKNIYEVVSVDSGNKMKKTCGPIVFSLRNLFFIYFKYIQAQRENAFEIYGIL